MHPACQCQPATTAPHGGDKRDPGARRGRAKPQVSAGRDMGRSPLPPGKSATTAPASDPHRATGSMIARASGPPQAGAGQPASTGGALGRRSAQRLPRVTSAFLTRSPTRGPALPPTGPLDPEPARGPTAAPPLTPRLRAPTRTGERPRLRVDPRGGTTTAPAHSRCGGRRHPGAFTPLTGQATSLARPRRAGAVVASIAASGWAACRAMMSGQWTPR